MFGVCLIPDLLLVDVSNHLGLSTTVQEPYKNDLVLTLSMLYTEVANKLKLEYSKEALRS